MHLRKLEMKDAPFMLEWMHDETVVKDLRTDFANKTLDDCINFIEAAQKASENLHMAIVDDTDEYMGTVSLKHITAASAEFGITVRKCAMGKGYAQFAMRNILDRGLKDLSLQEIYWCVSPDNHRALGFYDKQGFCRSSAPKESSGYTQEEQSHLVWYCASAVQ